MWDKLFVEELDSQDGSLIRPRKGVIIGAAGQVGIACAYSLLIQNCFDELILQDLNEAALEGEVMDLTHGLSFLPPTEIKMGSVAVEGRGADIVIITAGAAQLPGQTRLDLVEQNCAIYAELLKDVVEHCPDAILLIVSNPVDIMTQVTLKMTGFPASRVIGSGTVLDTSRFRSLLAKKLGVDARSVHAYILGEHGDSEVPIWSAANVAGQRLIPDASCDLDEDLDSVFQQVRVAAYEIIKRKGYTSYAIGLAVTDIVKAILRDQERVLTVSSLISGAYGIDNVCLSLPTVINRSGIVKKVNLSINAAEEAQLRRSASVLKDVFTKLDIQSL